jgi:dipeptidyl aminopeptidase/acylaminoacyl peptidase
MTPTLLTFLAAAFMPAAETPRAAPARPLTVEQAAAVRTPSDLQFSPDGKRLAFQVALPAKGATRPVEVWVVDVATREGRRFTHSPKSDRMPRWSPDGKKLAFISDRDERAQVYVMPADGGEPEALTQGKNAVSAFEWSPDGQSVAFLAPEPQTEAEEKRVKDKDDARVVGADDKRARLWLITLADRKARQLTAGAWQVMAFRWAPDSNRLFALATDQPDSTEWGFRLLAVARAGGDAKTVFTPAGPVANLHVAPDGKSLSFTAPRGDGPSPHDLFLLPLAGGSPRNLTASCLDRPVENYTWQKDGRLLAVVQDGFRSRAYTVTAGGEKEPLEGISVNPTGPVAQAGDGSLAFVGQTATQLPEVWLLPPGGKAEPVTRLNAGFAAAGLVRPEYYRYASFDGKEIEAALFRRAGAGRAPLVVLVHGGPTGRWRDAYFSWAQLLATRGYAVCCPNVRGSTGYGWDFVTCNRGDWGGGDFKDVLAGVDDLVRRGVADPERLGIGGWSYGGYMAAWAITQTRRFKAAVVGACMSDLASEFGTENGAAGDRWFYGVPYENLDGFMKSSPITHVKNARTPALILHGENDRIDPIGQAQQLHRALRHYGVECEFVVYPREGHGLTEEKHSLDSQRRIVRWFDTHLK